MLFLVGLTWLASAQPARPFTETMPAFDGKTSRWIRILCFKLYDEGQCDLVSSQAFADKVLGMLKKMSAAVPMPPVMVGAGGPQAEGVYANEFYGQARIFRRAGVVWLALGSQEFPLQVTGPSQLASPAQPGKYEDIQSFLLNFDSRGFVVEGLGPEQFKRFERRP